MKIIKKIHKIKVLLTKKIIFCNLFCRYYIKLVAKISTKFYNKNIKEKDMVEYRYDTQLLIEGKGLNEDSIREYFLKNFNGDCLIAVGDEELIKIHFHTNEPWEVLKYCRTLGEIYDIVVEDMDRQARGLKG